VSTATLSTDELLEFVAADADEPPCVFDGCTNGARWAVRCPECGHDRHACDMHRRALDMLVPVLFPLGLTCSPACSGYTPIPIPWRPI
jgi:hypothetical protein